MPNPLAAFGNAVFGGGGQRDGPQNAQTLAQAIDYDDPERIAGFLRISNVNDKDEVRVSLQRNTYR